MWKLWKDEVDCIITSYPKEWMSNEISLDALLPWDFADLRTVEPWWKLILSSKAMLPLLWSKFPNHPNLLPAYFDDPLSTIG